MFSDYLQQYRDLDIDKRELIQHVSLRVTNTDERVTINAIHVLKVLTAYKDKKLDMQRLIDWCETIRFSDYYDYPEEENEQELVASIIDDIENQDSLSIFPDALITDEKIDKWISELSRFI